jgi:hypothetical protein
LTEFQIGDLVRTYWNKSVGVITDRQDQYWVVKFILQDNPISPAKDGGYLSTSLEHIT